MSLSKQKGINLVIVFFIGIFSSEAIAQSKDSLLVNASLQSCVQYAILHQPVIQQSLLDEQITERMIKSKLADWYPQIYFDYTYQRNFQLQTSVFQGNTVRLGLYNTSGLQLSLSQNIFNRDVLLASRSAKDIRTQVMQATKNNKIDVAVNVSKAYYDILLTEKQIDLLNEDVIRLEQSLKVAYNQYQGGIADKTDYKRATILLNNAKAQKRQNEESLKAKFAYLKEQMNFPASQNLGLQYDTTKMEVEAIIDTTRNISYSNRIEYQLLQTQKRLQEANLRYYKWSYIPSVTAYGNYNLNFLNDKFSKLYSHSYPNSYAGLTISLPIFQGTKRTQQVRQAELELKRVDYDIIALENVINLQYTQALANYKSNMNYYLVLKENLELARDVYNTIQLQYKAGIKAYLEVITAEADLRAAQVNYTDALYQVLSSKLDVERALGITQY